MSGIGDSVCENHNWRGYGETCPECRRERSTRILDAFARIISICESCTVKAGRIALFEARVKELETLERKLSKADSVYVVMRGPIPMENAGLLRVWDYEDGAKAEAIPDDRGGTVTVRAARLVLEDS